MSGALLSRYRLGTRLPACRAVEAWEAVGPDDRRVTVTAVRCDESAAAQAGFDAIAQVRHTSLAALVEWGWADGRCVVVSDRPAGTDLESIAPPPFPASDVAAWGAQAAEGLAALHEHGLVHGGLCPAVLVLDEEGDVTLTGAGIAVAAGPSELGDADPPQNAFFVSPEEVLAQALTRASDVYALAATLYQLATGRPPFEGPDALAVARGHVAAPLVPPRQVRPDLPAALDHILRRALDKDPRERPSAALLARDLQRAALGARVEAPVVPEGPGPRPRRPWWPWVLGLALIMLLAGVLWGAGVFAGDVSVPDVTGLTESEARATLTSVGLVPGVVTRSTTVDPESAAGTVLDQTPAPGTSVREGGSVDLTLTGGVTVPDVVGMTEGRAREAISAAGLVVNDVTTTLSTTVAAGLVVAQFPAAGVTVASGGPVTLRVSAGPPPTASPSSSPSASPSPEPSITP